MHSTLLCRLIFAVAFFASSAGAATCPTADLGNGDGPVVCANHGNCDTETGSCYCDPGWTFSDCSVALSARVAVSYVTTINAVLNESALRTHTGSSNIVLLCASANLGRGCVAPRNTTDGLQIQEHVIGFRDSGTRTGTQYAYEFQAQANSVASRKLGYALMKTYLPNGAPRKVVDLFNTCPSYSFGAGQPALSCSGKGKCVAGKGGLNQCVCVDGFSGDDCSRVLDCSGNADCSARGICTRGGKCKCDPGWTGDTCSQRTCPRGCSQHGTCNDQGKCVCDVGWTSADCSRRAHPCIPEPPHLALRS